MSKQNGRHVGRVDAKALPPPSAIDRIPPPHDLEAEGAVLAELLVGQYTRADIPALRSTAFFSGANRHVMLAIEALDERGLTADVIAVAGWLRDHEQLGTVGGLGALTGMLNTHARYTRAAFLEHARRVETLAKLRELAAVVQRVNARVYVDHADPSDVFAEAERLVTDVVRSGPGLGTVRAGVEEIFESPLDDEPPWLCPKLLLAPGRVNLVAGAPDSGKTLAWQSVGVSIAGGFDLWSVFPQLTRGLVVHLNWDQPKADTYRRYRKILRGMGRPIDALRGYLEVVDDPQWSIDTDAGLAELRAVMREAKLVIIDALTGALSDTDEKDPVVGARLRKIGKLSEQTGCVVVIIHHAVKPPQLKGRGAQERDAMHDVRGSTAIPGAAGAIFVQSTVKKAELYAVKMARPPTGAKRALDPFGLLYEDIAQEWEELDGTRKRTPPAVRITYLTGEELVERGGRVRGSKTDGQAAFEDIARRVLEVVKREPLLNTSAIHARMSKVGRPKVEAALGWMAKAVAGGRPPLVVQEKGEKNANVWRAV